MPNYNLIFQFAGYGYGWSERWALNGVAVGRALIVGDAFRLSRATLLGSSVSITRWTIRDIDVKNASSGFSETANAPSPVVGQEMDTPWNSVLVFPTGGNATYRRRLWLRGVPDGAIQFDAGGNPLLDPAFKNLITAFLVTGNNNNVGWRVQNVALPANAPKQIGGLAVDAIGRVQINCPLHGFTLGQSIGISKVTGINLRQQRPGRKQVNGYWKVAAIADANNFSIALPVYTLTGTPQWKGKGQAKGLATTFVQLDPPALAAFEWRFARKSTGRQANIIKGKAPVAFRTFD